MTTTKRDIIEAVYSTLGMTRQDSVIIVESLFDILKKELTNGNDVMISGFGKWSVRKRKGGACRNPQTGESMQTNERIVVTFKNSALLKAEINKNRTS